MALHLSDLGGEDHCSQAELSLVRRAACLTVELERLEYNFATSPDPDTFALDAYQRTASSLRRLLETLGLKRRCRDVILHPFEYAKQYSQRKAAEAEEAEEATAS
jgi:hypothetical protein